jgi:inhibitor of cysteine peptidase
VPELVLTEQETNKSFDLNVGEPVVIRLAENPTTGYLWNIDQLDENVLSVEGSEFSQSPGGGLVGAGGIRTIRLRPKGPGVTQLSLTNKRPWEGDASAVGQFAVTLRISP